MAQIKYYEAINLENRNSNGDAAAAIRDENEWMGCVSIEWIHFPGKLCVFPFQITYYNSHSVAKKFEFSRKNKNVVPRRTCWILPLCVMSKGAEDETGYRLEKDIVFRLLGVEAIWIERLSWGVIVVSPCSKGLGFGRRETLNPEGPTDHCLRIMCSLRARTNRDHSNYRQQTLSLNEKLNKI